MNKDLTLLDLYRVSSTSCNVPFFYNVTGFVTCGTLAYISPEVVTVACWVTAQECSGFNRMEPCEQQADGWCVRPMDGHGQLPDALYDGVTARAASCDSCPWRRPLSVCDMMARRGAGASPVSHTSPDASHRSLVVPFSLASPSQGEEAPDPFLGRRPSMPWLGGSASVPLISPHEMLPGGDQGKLSALFVVFSMLPRLAFV
jgi:hypothetical protein